jgi:hypothetical protein
VPGKKFDPSEDLSANVARQTIEPSLHRPLAIFLLIELNWPAVHRALLRN